MKSVLRNPLNPDKREVYNACYIENAAMLGKSLLLCKCGEMNKKYIEGQISPIYITCIKVDETWTIVNHTNKVKTKRLLQGNIKTKFY